jgi:hypothetical protein
MDHVKNEPAVAEKRGRLVGGAATDEVLASSRSVLSRNRAGGTRGVQQYFTPLPVAGFISSVFGPHLPVFDPTAGDGALLSGFAEASRFGCEIDADQVVASWRRKRPYSAVRGDLQHVYPLLQRLGVGFPVVVCNPPFGLDWEVPGLDVPKGSSTLLSFLMSRGLLCKGGQGCLIAGRDRFYREVHPVAENQLFAIVEIDRLFPRVELPCVVAFFANKAPIVEGVATRAYRAHLDSGRQLNDDVRAAVRKAGTDLFGSLGAAADSEVGTKLEAVQKEYDRRLGRRISGQAHTIELEGGRLRIHPSPFTAIALATHKDGSQHRWLLGFDKQAPSYFALQGREWQRMLALADDCAITIADNAHAAIEAAIHEGERLAVPLYEVSPAQRLGFLVDVDRITCTISDPARNFVAGNTYAVDCETQVLATEAQRERQTPDGPEIYKVVVERKAMRITIGGQHFDESPEHLDYILAHFDVPDPGEIASRFPVEIARYEALLAEIEREIQERVPGFRFRWFQPRDTARLLFKSGGVLAWEQGLGKTLAMGAFVRGLEKAGELGDDCALFVMPQDLSAPQFSDAMMQFFGRQVVWITQAASEGQVVEGRLGPLGFSTRWRVAKRERRSPFEKTAVEVREMVRARRADLRAQHHGVHLAPRPPVWAVTWFEALAITQRIEEKLPLTKVCSRLTVVQKAQPAHWGHDEHRQWRWLPATAERTERKQFYSNELCPLCRADVRAGWDPDRGVCSAPLARAVDAFHDHDQVSARRSVCGYVHRARLRKPAYSILNNLFRCVLVDEGTKVQGDESLTSKSVRGIRAKYRVLSTGTPLKNYVTSMFWLLYWALGDSSPRFPYAYCGGKDRFTRDFAVLETKLDSWGHKEKRARPKVLPEVSNLSRLWRMTCSSIVRRRMDEVGAVVSLDGEWSCPKCKLPQRVDVTGPAGWRKPPLLTCEGCSGAWDSIAPLTYVPVHVPWGRAQKRFYARWLDKNAFVAHFFRKHPGSPIPDRMVPLLAASLGQLAKLSYATTDPTGDPDDDYKTPDLSPWTPGRLKLLELAAEHVARGDQVLIGSSHVAVGPWVAATLRARGIAAAHICEADSDGKMATIAPRKRARAVADFKNGKARVLCVGVNAIAFGHSLECASVAILDGLPWDFATFDQFIKRIRRLNSQRPITVYIIMPPNSLTTKIWHRLKNKTAASDIALDGKLVLQVETPIELSEILDELVASGATPDGTEVPEVDVRARWYGGTVGASSIPAAAS